MTETAEPLSPAPSGRRRRGVLLATAGVAIAVAAVGLALFQPWKLWVDDEVDQAAPAGAVPITVGRAEAAPATTGPPATAPVESMTSMPAPAAAPTTISPPPTVAPTPTTPPPPPAPAGGPFVGIDHGTTGTAILLQDPAGAQLLRLEALDTSNGPDLFVYLSTNAPDGPEGQFDDDFVNLGRLQGNVGSSNYAIPADTDLSRYASVVIWCDRFNSAFGAAPLP